jgi:uncharacterized protein (DUF1810 family)
VNRPPTSRICRSTANARRPAAVDHLEQRIAETYDDAMRAARRGDEQAHWLWQRFAELHAMRSPQTVERLEHAMGLA